QLDARRGLAGGRAEVKPGDPRRRTRVQVELARPLGAERPDADAELIAGALVVYRGELVGVYRPGRRHAGNGPAARRYLVRSPVADRREPRAGGRLQVRQQVQFALDVAGLGPDHLTDRHHPPGYVR